MSVRLTVKLRSEAAAAPREVVLDEQNILLGRDQTCQVVLAEQAVSRRHAQILRDGALFFIEDLGSAFGTQVNGKKLPKGEKRLLRNGDVIAIAQFDVTFDRLAELQPSAEKTSFVARQVVKDLMKGLGQQQGPFFRVMNGPEEGKRIELSDAQELVVGRDEGSADVVFKDDLISRKHCKIRRDWSGTHVEDLNSRNGIKVNKKRVNRRTLRDRDELQVGGVRLLYLDPSAVRDSTESVLPEEPHNTVPPDDAPKTDGKGVLPGRTASTGAPQVAGAAAVGPGAAPAAQGTPAEEPEEDPEDAEDDAEDEGGEEDEEAEDEGEEEEEEEEDEEEEDAIAPAAPPLSPKAKVLLVSLMGVFGVFALILIILILAGA